MNLFVVNVLLGVSFFAAVVLAIVLLTKSRDVGGKIPSLTCWGISAWVLVSFAFYNFEGSFINLLAKIQYVAGIFMLSGFLLIAYSFWKPGLKCNDRLIVGAVAVLIVFSILTVVTNLFIKGAALLDHKAIVFGSFYYLYVLYFAGLTVFGYYFVIKAHRAVDDRTTKTQLLFLAVGCGLSIAIGFLVNIILPFIGISDYLWWGPISVSLFAALISYAILRHHLFDVRLVTTELLVFAILIVVFVQIFLSKTSRDVFLGVVIFLAVGLLSFFLLKSINREIKQHQEIENLAHRLSDAISFAAHELRTPITKFRGYISMLLDGDCGELKPEVKKSLEICFGAAAEMNGNIETFLNLNKLEAGKLETRKQKIDLQEIVADCLADFSFKAKEKNIALIFQKDDSLPEVFADKVQIRHVVNNLISNAIKYTPEGGIVAAQLSKDEKTDGLIFSIEDTGIGIPHDVLPRLFSRYERGGERAKSISEGSGMGLFLAKEIVEMHHGRIWAESRGSGEGSRFSFSLPMGGDDVRTIQVK